jgi:hypothetical protein
VHTARTGNRSAKNVERDLRSLCVYLKLFRRRSFARPCVSLPPHLTLCVCGYARRRQSPSLFLGPQSGELKLLSNRQLLLFPTVPPTTHLLLYHPPLSLVDRPPPVFNSSADCPVIVEHQKTSSLDVYLPSETDILSFLLFRCNRSRDIVRETTTVAKVCRK